MGREDLESRLQRLHPESWTWTLVCCRGDRTEAEEVLQTAYLKVLDGRARFGGRSSLKTWLFGVIRLTAAGRRRRQRVRSWLLERWSREQTAAAPPDVPGARLESGERAARVRAALAALSRRQRQVLELVFYHGLTVREAARVIGVSVGTASVHYDRGKKELLRRLDGGVA